MITVGTFKSKLTPKLHGTSLNRVSGVYDKIAEAAFTLLTRIDPYTTIRRARIENAIYDRIFNYTAATDLKGNSKVVDIRPVGERSSEDSIVGAYSRQFDTKKFKDTFTIEVINGVKTLRVSKPLTPRTPLHRCDSLTLEGTVSALGDAGTLVTDSLDRISGSNSLKFALSGSTGQGIIRFDLNSTIDLSNMEDVGALFHWLKFPNASRLTNVKFRFGDQSGNYWTITATASHDRAFESDAWLLNRYDWEDAVETGTPVSTTINRLEVEINYSAGAALSNVRLDNITAALGQVYEMLYYSNCLFRSADGATYKTIPTLDTDVILLDDQDTNILLYEAVPIFGQEIKGKNMASDLKFCEYKLNGSGDIPGLYDRYEEDYPSQALEHQEEYYRFGEIGPHADDGAVWDDDQS